MTTQYSEILKYNGEYVAMPSEPLNVYLKKKEIEFVLSSTACWRGYKGKWEIENEKLFLNELEAYIEGYKVVGINYLFPEKQRVFADWFSGEVRIVKGELLKYVHMGYQSIYEKDIFLEFKNGILIKKREVDNREIFLKQKEEGYKIKQEQVYKKSFWKKLFDK